MVIVVEAGGVEPPSEKVPDQKTTCLVGSKSFAIVDVEPTRIDDR